MENNLDTIFQAADFVGYSATDYLPEFQEEHLVVTDRLWNDEYVSQRVHSEPYNIPVANDEAYHQAIQFPQISNSSLQYELLHDTLPAVQSTLKRNTAFRKYTKYGVQFRSASAVKQKSLKRCFDFLSRTYKNSRTRSSWEADDGMVEESYAFTHKIAERNRRTKLSQQFSALHSLLPHTSKKVDKHSILSNAIMELSQLKLRIGELEQQNRILMNALTQNVTEGCSSLSEAVVVFEESTIPDEVIMQVALKNKASNSAHMEAIITILKCLRELKLEVVKIQCRETRSSKQVIEVIIRRKTKGERWEMDEKKQFEEMVKRALTST